MLRFPTQLQQIPGRYLQTNTTAPGETCQFQLRYVRIVYLSAKKTKVKQTSNRLSTI